MALLLLCGRAGGGVCGWVGDFEISSPSMAAAVKVGTGVRSNTFRVILPLLPCFVTSRKSLTLSEPLPLSYKVVGTTAPTPWQFGGFHGTVPEEHSAWPRGCTAGG